MNVSYRLMVEPDIRFSQWALWRERESLKSPDGQPSMGAYLWGHFPSGPPAASPYPELPKELIYVGETNDLNTRPLGGTRHHRLKHYLGGVNE